MKVLKWLRYGIHALAVIMILTAILSATQREMFISAMIKTSYIDDINLPTHQSWVVQDSIAQFNKFVPVRIQYTQEEKLIPDEGLRPIYFKEMPEFLREKAAGMALVLPFACLIYINPEFYHDEKYLRHIVIHETLHCMGYDHTVFPGDVMYPTIHRNVDHSYFWYFLDLLKKKKEWGAI